MERRDRGCRALVVSRALVFPIALAGALSLGACDDEVERPQPPKPASRAETAARLLRVELDTRILRLRVEGQPSLESYTARLNALDALLEHIARTTRFLAEERLRAAEVGTDVAGLTFDLMRADFEATVLGVQGAVRSSCNTGIEWTGVGIQGLARDPGWADQTEEVERALDLAAFHRDNVLTATPIVAVMKAGVGAASVVSGVSAAYGLTRSGLAALARLSAWMERGGAAYGVLQVAPGGGAAIQLVTSGGALVLTHAEVIALVNAGQLSATAAALHMMAQGQPPKLPSQEKAVEEWAKTLPTRQTPQTTPAGKYEIAKTGPKNYHVKGSGQDPVWADGLRSSDGHLLEAKHIRDPASSPYVDGSSCYEPVRAKALKEMVDQFARYAAVIRDSSNPIVGMEVIVSDARAVPFFERLMARFSIPGQVVVSPP